MLLKITTDKLTMKYDDKGGIVRRTNFLLNSVCTNQVSLYPVTSSVQPWERLKIRLQKFQIKNFPMPHFPDALNSWLLAGLKEKKKQSEHLTIACLIFLLTL